MWILISNSGIQKMSYWGQNKNWYLDRHYYILLWFGSTQFDFMDLTCIVINSGKLCSVTLVFNSQVVTPELFLQGVFNKQGFLACNICVNQAFYFSVGGSFCSRGNMQHCNKIICWGCWSDWHSGAHSFHSNGEVEMTIGEWLQMQEPDFCHNRIFKLVMTYL
jgi:hypothetical protein